MNSNYFLQPKTITSLSMRQGFGLNTDLFETNILNLRVVVRVVVTVVGDAFRSLLDQRRQNILITLQEVDKKVREAQQKLEEIRRFVEGAHLQAQEIRMQAVQLIERESCTIQEQLKDDLNRLRERRAQIIQLERRRMLQTLAQQIANFALTNVKSTFLKSWRSGASSLPKQKELNEFHVRETFRQLKG